MTGPFETDQQVRELPAVKAIYDAMYTSHRRGVMGELGHRLLGEACQAAGVEVGAYDDRILVWLAGFEPETCAVVAGLITRAHEAGRAAPAAVAEDTRRLNAIREVLNHFNWETDDRQLALEAIERIADGGQP
jgi:hypothetical protein